jgi:hypothetical protein
MALQFASSGCHVGSIRMANGRSDGEWPFGWGMAILMVNSHSDGE